MKKCMKCAAMLMVVTGVGSSLTAGTIGYWNMQDAAAGSAAKINSVVKSSVNAPALNAKVYADGNTKMEFSEEVPGRVIVAGKDAKVINADNKSSIKMTSKSGNRPGLTVAGNKLLNQDAFTVEAFVKIEKIASWGGIMAKQRAKGNFSWQLQNLSKSGKIRARVDSNPFDAKSKKGFNQGINTSFVVADGKWHHIAITYDALTQKFNIYGDYKLLISRKTTLPIVYDNSPLTMIGGSSHGLTVEAMDEVRISDKVLLVADFLKVK